MKLLSLYCFLILLWTDVYFIIAVAGEGLQSVLEKGIKDSMDKVKMVLARQAQAQAQAAATTARQIAQVADASNGDIAISKDVSGNQVDRKSVV